MFYISALPGEAKDYILSHIDIMIGNFGNTQPRVVL